MIHRTTQEARRGQPHGSRVERLAVGERLRPTSGNAGPSATSQSRSAFRQAIAAHTRLIVFQLGREARHVVCCPCCGGGWEMT